MSTEALLLKYFFFFFMKLACMEIIVRGEKKKTKNPISRQIETYQDSPINTLPTVGNI